MKQSVITFAALVVCSVFSCALLALGEGEIEDMLFFHEWEQWKATHNRVYSTRDEHDVRYLVFKDNIDYINAWNKEGHSCELGVNQWADLTNDEFRDLLGTPQVGSQALLGQQHPRAPGMRHRRRDETGSLDYRKLGAVTAVKNQGQCGSCWAFSIVAACEGASALAGNKLADLSEQQVADCSKDGGNDGCNGGDTRAAMEYVIAHGLESFTDYPYKQFSGSCKYNKDKVRASFTDYVSVTEGDEDDLTETLKQYGPVSVALDASQTSFQFYKSGVYFDARCSSTNLDHGVTLVGYGHDEAQGSYWVVKNSWGLSWGEQGYIRIARNKDNHCGIATYATAPVAARPHKRL